MPNMQYQQTRQLPNIFFGKAVFAAGKVLKLIQFYQKPQICKHLCFLYICFLVRLSKFKNLRQIYAVCWLVAVFVGIVFSVFWLYWLCISGRV